MFFRKHRFISILLALLALGSLAAGYLRLSAAKDGGESGTGEVNDIVAPDFKLPLLGDKSWLLTVEAGGKAFGGADDPYHMGESHFAIDFDDINKEDGPLKDVPVLAAAAGTVDDLCADKRCASDGYGYYVVINHNYPEDNGYKTIYGHLKEPPAVDIGQAVRQGDIIGIMGSTGISSGSHIHLQILYDNKSDQSVPELKKLLVDGMTIESYKVNPKGNSLNTYNYYRSTNLNPKVKLKRR